MKSVAVMKWVFMVVGAGLLGLAGWLYQGTSTFIARAATAEGTVVDLARSSGSKGGSTWRPVVRFETPDGEAVQFTSSMGSNPPSHQVGDRVEVLYLPDAPREAKIREYLSLWGPATIVGGIGAVFFLIGAGITLWGVMQRRKEEDLRLNGTRIEADLQGVEQNTSIGKSGSHPWRLVAQWHDPSANQVHVFRSRNLWLDPTKHVGDRKHVTVFVERGNPKRYHVDLSFLPKLAE